VNKLRFAVSIEWNVDATCHFPPNQIQSIKYEKVIYQSVKFNTRNDYGRLISIL
jgi:hypothetical protein